MNQTLVKFCEVERRAAQIYSNGYKPKGEVFNILESEFDECYSSVLLIGLESAAEAYNFHDDVGPWMRDLKENAGHFTYDDLQSTRHFIKFN